MEKSTLLNLVALVSSRKSVTAKDLVWDLSYLAVIFIKELFKFTHQKANDPKIYKFIVSITDGSSMRSLKWKRVA